MLKRCDVDEKLKWNLKDVCSSEEHLEENFKKFEEYIDGVQKFKGKLKNVDAVCEYFKFCEKYDLVVGLTACYLEMLSSEDVSNEKTKKIIARFEEVCNRIVKASAFVEPELLKLKDDTFKKLIVDKRLKNYKYALERLFASKKHALSEKETIILNEANLAFNQSEIFEQFNSSEVSHGKVKLSDGKTVELTYGLYSQILDTETREVRRKAAKAYSKQLEQFGKTIGTCYLGDVKATRFNAKMHKFKSSLERSLFESDIPEIVYRTLIKNYTENLNYLKRYLLVRKHALKLDNLYGYDMWVSLSKYKPKKSTYNECFDTVLKALNVFGEDYLNILKTARDNRWIDVMETENKTTGAYELGVYGVHPYVLFNFDNTEGYASTIAHELGHAVNSYLSEKNNPYPTSENPIFLAEIASTVNEVLLYKYLIDTSENNKEKQIYYLTEFISMFNGTFFRQANFAKFEEEVHNRVDANIPTSVFDVNNIYLKLVKEYNQGVIETSKKAEIAYQSVPHFYRPFYVYKYATGIISAINIVCNILENKNYIKNYFEFLSAGSKQNPIDTLKLAKVDLSLDETYKKAFNFVNTYLTKLENLTK